MPLNRDMNTSPYYDDYSDDKNFHRVLFKPGYAVQARELTQLQTMLQAQIERFGDNILKEGTIVSGGNFIEEASLPYVKIKDRAYDPDGTIVTTSLSSYKDMRAIGLTTGLQAMVVTSLPGLESQSPNLNTLYIRYINNAQDSAGNNISVFSTTEEIQLQQLDPNTGTYQDFRKVTAAGNTESASVGLGYGLRCGDGIIFQKGFFSRFSENLVIVSRYTNSPDGLVVGFETTEEIINSDIDSSLLDNANGFNNYNAPGADRLKLVPTLVVKSKADAVSDPKFFAIQEYSKGKVVRRNLVTQYNLLGDMIDRRTKEESGDYVVTGFDVSVGASLTDTSNLGVSVSSGIGYVEGSRVELTDSLTVDTLKAINYETIDSQNIVTNYGNYVVCESVTGKFTFTNFSVVNLINGSSTQIGTAKIRSVTRHNSGVNLYRLYLLDIVMDNTRNFKDVRTIEDDTSDGEATVVLEGGAAKLNDVSFKKSVFPLGQKNIRSIDSSGTDYVYRTQSNRTCDSAGLISITLSGDDVFPFTPGGALNSDQLRSLVVISSQAIGSYSVGEIATVNSATLNVSGKTLTMSITAPTAAMTCVVYYDVKKTSADITVKNLVPDVFVKIDTDTNSATDNNYCLGFPGVYKILGVYKGSTYSTSNADVTNYFELSDGQKDIYYGLSYMRKKSGLSISSGDKLLVKLAVFERGAGTNAFFTVDSYPVDDVSTPLPANKIRTQDIPFHYASDGVVYNLRDSIDMRPYCQATATVTTSIASATINPSDSLSFVGVTIPAPNAVIETTYDYYLGRKDIVVIDDTGEIIIVKGTPGVAPIKPIPPNKGMVLATLNIPPYPSLPSIIANRAGKTEYGVSVSKGGIRRYTMKDIWGIDNRLSNLEYYSALSLLEKETSDLVITDANGLDMFKNGIFVDNFSNLLLSDVNGGEFAAGLNPATNEMTPMFRAYPLELDVLSVSGVTNHGDVITLNSNTEVLMSQPYATNTRSCTDVFYKYNGTMYLTPEYDMAVDYTQAPDVNIREGAVTSVGTFSTRLNNIIPAQFVANADDNFLTTRIGEYVSDIDIHPFMRSRDIRLVIHGLRPLTRHYFFFDGVDVNEHVATATLNGGVLVRNSNFGAASIISDSTGRVNAMFRIPEGTFIVGDRTLEVVDVSVYSDIDTASSIATKRYSAYNYSVEKAGLTVSTRIPTVNPQPEWSDQDGSDGPPDPIAQTFFISPNKSNDRGIMLSHVDLFFATKGTNGITVEIRETDNGFPGAAVVPFSTVYLDSTQVISNASSADTPTSVIFENPVTLRTGAEYVIVIKPDGNDPNYRIWLSRTGNTDVDSGVAVTQDTNAGVLFTSTNNKTWTPYQNENIKFTLHKHLFTSNIGSVVLGLNDVEFFNVVDVADSFKNGEVVYKEKSTFLSGNVSMTYGSNVILGSGTDFTADYEEGDYIVAPSGGAFDVVMKVSSIANTTYMTSSDIASANVSGESDHYSAVGGVLRYFDDFEPPVMILDNSNAKTGAVFEAADIIIGADSGAVATISEVLSLPVSYFQPTIYSANFTKTRSSMSASKLWNGGSYYSKEIDVGANMHLNTVDTFVKSKSIDQTTSGFEITVVLENTSQDGIYDTSPVIDHTISGVTMYEFFINNDTTNEIGRFGSAKAKYVSRRIDLSDSLFADDIRVFVNAYKPFGTDIGVYVKFASASDDRPFDNVEWTRLVAKNETNLISSTINLSDYKEIEFGLDSTVLGDNEGAYLDGGTDFTYKIAGAGTHTDYKYFAVKVVLLSDRHSAIPKIKDLRAIALS